VEGGNRRSSTMKRPPGPTRYPPVARIIAALGGRDKHFWPNGSLESGVGLDGNSRRRQLNGDPRSGRARQLAMWVGTLMVPGRLRGETRVQKRDLARPERSEWVRPAFAASQLRRTAFACRWLASRSSREVSGKPSVSEGWCGRGDSNPHVLVNASPSSCPVSHLTSDYKELTCSSALDTHSTRRPVSTPLVKHPGNRLRREPMTQSDQPAPTGIQRAGHGHHIGILAPPNSRVAGSHAPRGIPSLTQGPRLRARGSHVSQDHGCLAAHVENDVEAFIH